MQGYLIRPVYFSLSHISMKSITVASYCRLDMNKIMEHLMVSAIVVGAIFLASIGRSCLLRPVSVQYWVQRQHNRRNKFVQNLRFSKHIFKARYPTYLRFMGVSTSLGDS
jgi:hypothetical protein